MGKRTSNIIFIGKWPASKEYFVMSEEFCAVVKRIADVCLNGSDTKPAVDEAYPELCQEFEVILENNGPPKS